MKNLTDSELLLLGLVAEMDGGSAHPRRQRDPLVLPADQEGAGARQAPGTARRNDVLRPLPNALLQAPPTAIVQASAFVFRRRLRALLE